MGSPFLFSPFPTAEMVVAMADRQMRNIRLFGMIMGVVFFALLAVRIGLFDKRSSGSAPGEVRAIDSLPDKDAWMNIFQGGKKIGYSHTVLRKIRKGYQLEEDVFMRINTMDVSQDLKLRTRARMGTDLALETFDFEIGSGRFRFAANGRVDEHAIRLSMDSGGSTREVTIPVYEKPFLSAGILHAVAESDPAEGEVLRYAVFDPVGMKTDTVHIRVYGRETIRIGGKEKPAKRIALQYQGVSQTAWINENGEVLKEEGLLGIHLEKTTSEDALFGLPVQASQDLTRVASVASNVVLQHPEKLKKIVVRIGGIRVDPESLSGGRQMFADGLLTVRKEVVPNIREQVGDGAEKGGFVVFLEASPFIQAGHPYLREIVQQVTLPGDGPVEKVRKLMAWIDTHIEKRPVLSMPDALSTLQNRMGDCNEHAVLLAALLRTAGIPADVEAGLVYMRGRFYYHAWNRIHIGIWITVDALFGQFPADVTHLRFATGTEKLQSDLVHLIDRVKIEVIEWE